jgi:hypothetical protein
MVLMKKFISLFEIALIFFGGFAFAYIIGETNSLFEDLPVRNKENKFFKFVREKTLNYLSNGLVSAQSSIQTCLLDVVGSFCQEYPAETCDSQCTEDCFPGSRDNFSPCELGTCYDPNQGLCNSGTPILSCENNGGIWSSEEPVQCNRECCLINPDGSGGASQAKYTTEQQCNSLGRSIGSVVSWESVSSELECLQKATTQSEGACVLEFLQAEQKYVCELVTKSACLSSGGTFYSGVLCTNPDLNTQCEKTQNTQCFDDKDRVYFVDSCGNRGNVYDSTKLNDIEYWSSVVYFRDSCSLSSGSNFLGNQQTCGNCDYLKGSICGNPNPIDEQPEAGEYVCRDLSCIDRNGERREHGESWCVFDGQIGLDGLNGTNEERSVDVPGSRHYRELCYEGELRLEPCAEYRNGVCVEQDLTPEITNAQCRTNTGVLCTRYNENEDELAKCGESPDCYLKHVELDKFKFDMCVPKYPIGLELADEPQTDSQLICAVATQTCTYYEKKSLDGRWSCKINCECKSAGFAETMNNLCMSLGDCGSHVNLAGELGDGYSTSGDESPKISDSYVESLRDYITPRAGQRVSGLTNEQIASLFGLDPADLDSNELAKQISQLGLGAATTLGLYLGLGGTASTSSIAIASPYLTGFSTVLSAAAAGAGIGYIVGLAFDLEGDELTTATAIGAGVGVAASIIYAYSAATVGTNFASTLILAATAFFWIAVAVAVIVAIISIAGVGEYRERKVEFSCLPWQPPTGGNNCDECNNLGVGECTTYKCKSLGKTCDLVNPGTENAACININPGDSSAPVVIINDTVEEEYTYQRSNTGVEIKSSENGGCFQEYRAVTFGIVTDEIAQCKISAERTASYEEMENTYFDSSGNFYVANHVKTIGMPTLDSLGVTGISPNRKGDYDLFVRCEDKSGNSNDVEYGIRFCVSPANDVEPPIITKFIPEEPGLVGLNTEEFDLAFYTNEPATCKFTSGASETSYSAMEGEVLCENGINQATLFGWVCGARLDVSPGVETGEYHFKCADQPWNGFNATQSGTNLGGGRNVNSQSTGYEIQRTTTPLEIVSVSPEGETIFSGVEPVSVDLEVSTSGGIDDGKAFCEYSFNSGVNYIDFFETSTNAHRQTFSTLFSGNHDIKIRCEDRAGNEVEGNARFEIEVDSDGPLITRIYNSGDILRVVTNEDSKCEYSLNSCSFDFGTGVLLSGGERVHTMSYTNGPTYRIKCQDGFGNVGTCFSVTGGY